MQYTKGIRSGLILGKTPSEERKKTYKKFEHHELDLLINVEVATEGCDLPEVDSILMLRPTESLSLYLQMIGRAMRPSPQKEYAIILDAFANYERHGLPEEDREWTLKARGKKKKGKAPTKLCKNCKTVNPISSRKCIMCEYEFGAICKRCGSFVTGLLKGEKCTLCNKEIQEKMFSSGVSTVIPATPKYIPTKKRYGVFVEGDKPDIGTTVLIKDGNGDRWKESIVSIVNRFKNGYVCETKSV